MEPCGCGGCGCPGPPIDGTSLSLSKSYCSIRVPDVFVCFGFVFGSIHLIKCSNFGSISLLDGFNSRYHPFMEFFVSCWHIVPRISPSFLQKKWNENAGRFLVTYDVIACRISSIFSSQNLPCGFPSMEKENVVRLELIKLQVVHSGIDQRAQVRGAALEAPSTFLDPVLLNQWRGALCPPLSQDARG